jgi:hypothetical protein
MESEKEFENIEDGAGCAEIWERLSEKRSREEDS